MHLSAYPLTGIIYGREGGGDDGRDGGDGEGREGRESNDDIPLHGKAAIRASMALSGLELDVCDD